MQFLCKSIEDQYTTKFVIMTTKWRILQNLGKLFMCITRLNNICINNICINEVCALTINGDEIQDNGCRFIPSAIF